VLAVACLLATMRGKGPYPLLVLLGEQGSAKSTFTAILRALERDEIWLNRFRIHESAWF
jgi:hypothetical protein